MLALLYGISKGKFVVLMIVDGIQLMVLSCRVTMNLGIIATCLPSLGRLVAELQPRIYTLSVDGSPSQTVCGDAEQNIPSIWKPLSPRYTDKNFVGPSAAVSVRSGLRDSAQEERESIQALVIDAPLQNVIRKTVHFEIH